MDDGFLSNSFGFVSDLLTNAKDAFVADRDARANIEAARLLQSSTASLASQATERTKFLVIAAVAGGLALIIFLRSRRG